VLSSSEGSILKQYQQAFEGYDIKLEMQQDAIKRVAELAAQQQTGARGLMTVLEKVLHEFKFELPSTYINKLTIDADAVDDPKHALAKLLKENEDSQIDAMKDDMKAFAKRFEQDHGIRISFTPKAIELLSQESLESGKTIRALCESKFEDYAYGLALIQRNTDKDSFNITKDAVLDPEGTISKWVTKSYEQYKKQ
jgi:ATP-dependent protease Clp ATPase subunit